MMLILVLCLLGVPIAHGKSHSQCYVHYDPAAKYQMRHDKTFYPTNEINLILEKSYPEMKSMFYDDNVPVPRPTSHFNPPPESVCPYERYMLYSFFYAGKDCYVVYPEIQKVMYIQCSNQTNRDCQTCSWSGAGYGAVHKCEEDYDYRYVWAYCTHRHVAVSNTRPPTPPQRVYDPQPSQPRSHVPEVKVQYHVPKVAPTYILPTIKLATHPPLTQPHRYQVPKVAPTQKPQPVYREYPANNGWRSSRTYVVKRPVAPQKVMVGPLDEPYMDPWNTMYRPHLVQYRWKRAAHTAPQGYIERMRLYLPHHCGCKRFSC